MGCLPWLVLGKRPGVIERTIVFGWITLLFANKWFCLSGCLCLYDIIDLQMYSIFISNKRFLILIIWGVRRPKYFTINYTRSLQESLRTCQGNFREFSREKICVGVWEPCLSFRKCLKNANIFFNISPRKSSMQNVNINTIRLPPIVSDIADSL